MSARWGHANCHVGSLCRRARACLIPSWPSSVPPRRPRLAEPRSRPHALAACCRSRSAAIGVVFGDIGTSPLYTLQVAGEVHAGGRLDRADVFGVVSLILWALTLAVSIKYVGFVMRADNHGEGGILALLSLLPRDRAKGRMGTRHIARPRRAPRSSSATG